MGVTSTTHVQSSVKRQTSNRAAPSLLPQGALSLVRAAALIPLWVSGPGPVAEISTLFSGTRRYNRWERQWLLGLCRRYWFKDCRWQGNVGTGSAEDTSGLFVHTRVTGLTCMFLAMHRLQLNFGSLVH